MRQCTGTRAALTVLFAIAVLCVSLGSAQPAPSAPPAPTASAPPDLPSDVTLAMLVARRKHSCDIVKGQAVNHKDGPTYTAPLTEVAPQMMKLTPTTLDTAAAAPDATPCMKSMCTFLHHTSCPDGVAEAMIRANCKEKIYKNCEMIDAVASSCNPACVARWRTQYPDQ